MTECWKSKLLLLASNSYELHCSSVKGWLRAPKVALLTSYPFVASHFETKFVHELASILSGSLLVFLFSRTVFIRVGNDCECRCEQLFRQRPPASNNIDRTIQVNRLSLLCFEFTWSSAPVVSYYGPLLSSSKAGESIQPENRQLAKSSTGTPQSAATRLPRCGPTPWSHPFLLRKTITTNN